MQISFDDLKLFQQRSLFSGYIYLVFCRSFLNLLFYSSSLPMHHHTPTPDILSRFSCVATSFSMHKRTPRDSISLLENETVAISVPRHVASEQKSSKFYWKRINHEEKSYNRRSILRDPSTPYLISLYLQLAVNIAVVLAVFYFVWRFYKVISVDIQHKIELYTIELMEEVARCQREYTRNRCSVENGNKRIPALELMCTKWKKCMNRDPAHIGTGKIAAETFADIINGFFVHTTWKSLVFLTTITIGAIVLSNVAFGTYRRLYEPQRYEVQKIPDAENLVRELQEVVYDHQITI